MNMKSPERSPTMENPFTVTEALPEDAAGITHVRKETWLATYANPNAEAINERVTPEDILEKNLDSADQIARWRKATESKNGPRKIWVAKEKDGTVVGYSQGFKGETENQIYGLYVLPTHQGKGLGRKLLQCVIDWLGEQKPITLSVGANIPSAIELYKKFGFVEEGIGEGPIFASGATVVSIKMRKPGNTRPA